MTALDFIQTPWSLLPPVVALVLALTTRRVLLSLGAGIVLGTLLLNSLAPVTSGFAIGNSALGLLTDAGNLQLIGFLLLLGCMTALMAASGATRAFADWASLRVKNRRGAQVTAVLLGIALFIDDYFNSLAVGAVSRPLTDRYQVSRARLAYLLDSTAAPMCVITPISSWGAYIIAVVGGILASHGMTESSALGSFVAMIPMNYYAILALVLVICVAMYDINLGAMGRHETAAQNGQLFDATKGEPAGSEPEIHEAARGCVAGLLAPLVAMIIATVYMLIQTGAEGLAADGLAFSVLGAFEYCSVNPSLLFGGIVGAVVAAGLALRSGLPVADLLRVTLSGAGGMLSAIWVLLMAWMLTDVIGGLETGKYLSGLLGEHISAMWLPALLFVLAGLMAFATGTSWGTFGIMLPIAGDMAAATDIALMLPMLSAVLAGAVFGDHCSPISDTTILSSTGARSHHIDHVMTQLPYALLVAVLSLAGYLVLGVTGSVSGGLAVGLIGLLATVAALRGLSRRSAAVPVV